jgi:hypothetical protein
LPGLLLRAEKDKRMRLYNEQKFLMKRGLTLALSWRRGNNAQSQLK